MNHKLRQLIALILAMSMVLSLLSANVWAADTSGDSSDLSAMSTVEPQEDETEKNTEPQETEGEESSQEEAEEPSQEEEAEESSQEETEEASQEEDETQEAHEADSESQKENKTSVQTGKKLTAKKQLLTTQDSTYYTFSLTDNFGWGSAYVFAWDKDGSALLSDWPGSLADTTTNDYGETVFLIQVPTNAVGFIANNGNGAQTVDITNFSYEGFWMDGTKNDQGHYLVTGYGTQPGAVTGVSLNPSAAQTIEVDGKVSFTATVDPADATDKKVKWSVGGTDTGAVKLYSNEACTTEVGTAATDTLTVYAKGISAGSATVTATSNADSTKTASCDVTVNEAGSGGGSSDYTLTIPSTLSVANSGWNATDGISATGTLESGKKLTVTASSANSWALKSGDNSVGYKLATASTDTEATTSWEFTELSNTAATKPMGIIVDDYSSTPAGTYQDTVTFTAVIEDESCVTEGTLITLADGTQAPIETIKVGDLVQTWSFWNGRYEAQPVTVVINHGVDEYTVHSLVFSDGTVVETINEHGFYSPDLNDYAFISPENVDEYIGRHFVLQSKDGGNEIVTLAESKTEIRRVGSYSLLTAYNYNFMAEKMLTITMEYRPGCFHFFDIGDDMAYDSKKMAQDIERYGLYTADEFSEYVTPEQFDMLNGPYYKVLVGRGTLNDSDITKMIEAYLPEKSE